MAAAEAASAVVVIDLAVAALVVAIASAVAAQAAVVFAAAVRLVGLLCQPKSSVKALAS
jgi:hypothetical protein